MPPPHDAVEAVARIYAAMIDMTGNADNDDVPPDDAKLLVSVGDLRTVIRAMNAAPPMDADVAGLVDWLLASSDGDSPSVRLLRKETATMIQAQAAEIARLRAERAEATRRRDEWRAKAEGYDAVRLALRDAVAGKFGEDGPRTMSRVMWAGVAADEKKRADDAEAENARLRAELDEAQSTMQGQLNEYLAALGQQAEALDKAVMAERSACSAMVHDAATAIEDDERDNLTWGGPDPRGADARWINLENAKRLRELAKSLRARSAP